jgi:hypothetical protein
MSESILVVWRTTGRIMLNACRREQFGSVQAIGKANARRGKRANKRSKMPLSDHVPVLMRWLA